MRRTRLEDRESAFRGQPSRVLVSGQLTGEDGRLLAVKIPGSQGGGDDDDD
jgi:hypothetical protein